MPSDVPTPKSYAALVAEHGPDAFFELANLSEFTYDGLVFEQDRTLANSCAGIIWEAALFAAEHFTRTKTFARWGARSRKVLELGCGVGVLGALAARAGAATVMTDVAGVAFGACARNVERNKDAFGDRTPVVMALDWEDVDALKLVAATGPFDVVLGTDVVFSVKLVGALLTCVATTLKKSKSSASYICIQRRSLEAHAEFVRMANDMFDVVVVQVLDFAEDDAVEMFELRWRESDCEVKKRRRPKSTRASAKRKTTEKTKKNRVI